MREDGYRRIYHFLSADNALDDLRRKRIKLSEIDKLNDPFELWCSAQRDRRIRRVLHKLKRKMARAYGVLCFSRRWHNPVLWSHYADSHRGICLGFDVDDECFEAVNYAENRTAFQLPATEETMKQLLFTKYRDWQYEEEVRGWFHLEERDSSGQYFYSFDEKVRLRQVIAGPLCRTRKAIIDAALEGYEDHIYVTKARLAFGTFRVIKDKRGFPK
jgi:hypothetical protein